MRILQASSEVHPFSKTGGLADMVAGLAKAVAKAGHEVGLVTPLYGGIAERFPEIVHAGIKFDLPLGPHSMQAEVMKLELTPYLTVYFIDHPGLYHRPGLYQQDGMDYPDNP